MPLHIQTSSSGRAGDLKLEVVLATILPGENRVSATEITVIEIAKPVLI